MSIKDENLLNLVKTIFQRHGSWGFFSVFVLIPSVVGTLIALVTYNFTLVEYVGKLNYAANKAPVLAIAVQRQNDNIRMLGEELQTVTDTLRYDGYVFASFPKIETPILDLR